MLSAKLTNGLSGLGNKEEKWSWQQRGKIKYKELVKYQDQYNIKVYG
jgi:hypothetical protein